MIIEDNVPETFEIDDIDDMDVQGDFIEQVEDIEV